MNVATQVGPLDMARVKKFNDLVEAISSIELHYELYLRLSILQIYVNS